MGQERILDGGCDATWRVVSLIVDESERYSYLRRWCWCVADPTLCHFQRDANKIQSSVSTDTSPHSHPTPFIHLRHLFQSQPSIPTPNSLFTLCLYSLSFFCLVEFLVSLFLSLSLSFLHFLRSTFHSSMPSSLHHWTTLHHSSSISAMVCACIYLTQHTHHSNYTTKSFFSVFVDFFVLFLLSIFLAGRDNGGASMVWATPNHIVFQCVSRSWRRCEKRM